MSIFQILIEGIMLILTQIINLFPNADPKINQYLDTAITSLNNLIDQTDWLFPVSTFVIVFNIVLITEALFFSLRVGGWLLSHLTGHYVKSVV